MALFYVFDTEQEAEAAQQHIYDTLSPVDRNAKTGKVVNPGVTRRWAEPVQREDGKWLILVCPSVPLEVPVEEWVGPQDTDETVE